MAFNPNLRRVENWNNQADLYHDCESDCLVSAEEALHFLQSFKNQVEVYLADFEFMFEELNRLRCSSNYEPPRVLVKEEQKAATRMFSQLKIRLCRFMSNYQGIEFK